MSKHNHKELKIWKDAMEVVKGIYTLTDKFPSQEQFVLRQQLIRSGISIPSNIAEGAYRTTNKDFSRFLDIAMGSAAEAETQLMIAEWRGYISTNELNELTRKINEIQKMTKIFQRKLNH